MLDRLISKSLLFGIKRKYRGFGYVSNKLYKDGLVAQTRHSVSMVLDPYEYIDSRILRLGYFDESVLEAIMSQLGERDIFWDIGGNTGLHSLTVKKLKGHVDCYSFEPYYLNFRKMMLNQALNPDLAINKYNFGLSDDVEIKEIHTTEANHGRTGFHKLENTVPTKSNVLTTTGDALVRRGIPVPNVVKIDTEGHELAILRGCSEILQSPHLHAVVYEAISDEEEIEKYLGKYSFKSSPIDSEQNFLATRQ